MGDGSNDDWNDDDTDTGASGNRYRAPALDKGLDILEVLADQLGGLTRTEIVRRMGLAPSQIFRMLERLVARGYVMRIDGGDRYALTMKLFLLANRHPPLRRLVAQAQPLMDAFAQGIGQSVHLVMPELGSGVIVAQASPVGHWEFRARIGWQIDLFTTSSGMTLLAFQQPERLAETMGRWGIADGASRLAAVADHLTDVRKAGCRVAPSGQLVGVTDLSVPIAGPDGDAIAVLTCAYIDHPGDNSTTLRDRALDHLRKLAAELSFVDVD